MIGRKLLRFSPIALVLVAAACGGSGGGKTASVTQPSPTTPTATTNPATLTALRAYFLRDGKVQPVERTVPHTQAVAGAALLELQKGPTAAERQLGLTSAELPPTAPLKINGTTLSLTTKSTPDQEALAQLVYTLTQFAGRTSVEIDGKIYTRADFEDLTPLILVELPLPFETVTSPLRAAGSANTFEATFDYDLIGPDGKVIAHNFVTATSGNGIRGTFDFTVPFTVSQSGPGKFVVYELSAKDGSRVHQVEIPIRLEP
jgi:germination protein M